MRTTSETMARRLFRLTGPALFWLAVVLGWELAWRLMQWKAWLFPAPSHILDALLHLLHVNSGLGEPLGAGWPKPGPMSYAPGGLLSALGISLARLGVGYVASVAVGMLFGLCCHRWAWFDRTFGGPLLGLQTLPSVCWVPPAILLFGLKESSLQFVLIMGSFPSIALALRDGLRATPPIYRQAGLMLGARGLNLTLHVLLPSILPATAGGLRQGFSFAWRSLLGGELTLALAKHGLGFHLENGRNTQDTAQVFGMLAIMIAVGIGMDRLVFRPWEQHVRRRYGL